MASTTAGQNSVSQTGGRIDVEDRGALLIARIDGGPHAIFDAQIAGHLKELVERANRDPRIRAVVFTGTHPDRFFSHADVKWLQQGGVGFPPINLTLAGISARMARFINKVPLLRDLLMFTRFKTLLQLDSFHTTMLKMNSSGVIFVAALNGTTLAGGAEFAWACDVRIMADGDYQIGLPEVLLSLAPGGGGSQRLARLIGTQKSLVSILEGKPYSPAEALALGAVDEVVPQSQLLTRAIERAQYLSLRSKQSIGAVKRLTYFGSSVSLEEGLQLEHAEFLVLDQSKEAQKRMIGYMAETEATGDLPLLNRKTYELALTAGHIGELSQTRVTK